MNLPIFTRSSRLDDIATIKGIQMGDESIERRFYLDCQKYFLEKYDRVFEFSSSTRQPIDLFQDTFMILWAEIQSRHIFVKDGRVYRYRRDGSRSRMEASLKTYMMAIARYKNLELLREDEIFGHRDDADEITDGDTEETELTLEGIALMEVGSMPNRCREILTMFYIEGKSLDEILAARPENTSKDGLKSGKSKCVAQLKARIIRQLERLNIKTA